MSIFSVIRKFRKTDVAVPDRGRQVQWYDWNVLIQGPGRGPYSSGPAIWSNCYKVRAPDIRAVITKVEHMVLNGSPPGTVIVHISRGESAQ